VPQTFSGEQLPLPSNTTLENRFAAYYNKQGALRITLKALQSSLFYKEIIQHPIILIHLPMLLRLIKFVGDAEITTRWVNGWIKEGHINVENTLFYSFWFNQLALGIGLLKDRFSKLALISRAHGYDVYEERYSPPYWPCRRQALDRLDKLFLASYDARDYMLKRYPEYSELYETAHLGVDEPGYINHPSQDDVFRIVSCSSIVLLKRVGLLVKGVILAAQFRSEQKFEWTHFGDGPEMGAIQEMLKQLPNNATGNLVGFVPNDLLIHFYKNNSVDAFVNVSESEGGSPVSIQEATSCGIPIIVTNVGGNPEIASEENGILLKTNPTPNEIAQAFFVLIDNPDLALEKRKGSLNVWDERYNAQKNYEKFARQIASLMDK